MHQRSKEKSDTSSKLSLREIRDILAKVKKAVAPTVTPQESVAEHTSHAPRSSFVSVSLSSPISADVSLSIHDCSVMVDERSLLSGSPCLYPLARKGDAEEGSVIESEKDISDIEKESASDLQPLIRVVSGMEKRPEEGASLETKEEELSSSKECPPVSGTIFDNACW